MRSNDVILGTPTDIAFFCSLHIQAFNHLKAFYPDLELGTYTHLANSYHVYDRHYDLLDRMLSSDFKPVNLPPINLDLIEIDGSPSKDFKQLFDHINANSKDLLIFQDGNDLYKWIYTNLKK
jgi:thymidylate synthase